MTGAARARRAAALVLPNGDLWIFGYGSLMWDPDFPYVEWAPALIYGYHRALCIFSHRWRGTPERPGLVLGLDRGGACRGIAFRVAHADVESALDAIDAGDTRPRAVLTFDDGFADVFDHAWPLLAERITTPSTAEMIGLVRSRWVMPAVVALLTLLLVGAVLAWWQAANVAVKGALDLREGGPPQQRFAGHRFIRLPGDLREGQQGWHFTGKRYLAGRRYVEERTHAHRVARGKQRPRVRIPHGKGKVAQQACRATFSPSQKCVEHDRRVGRFRGARLQRRSDFFTVVQPAVPHQQVPACLQALDVLVLPSLAAEVAAVRAVGELQVTRDPAGAAGHGGSVVVEPAAVRAHPQ